MPIFDFLEHVRMGANLVYPEQWLDPNQEPVNNVERAESLASMWLTPAIVGDYSEDDFTFLPDDQEESCDRRWLHCGVCWRESHQMASLFASRWRKPFMCSRPLSNSCGPISMPVRRPLTIQRAIRVACKQEQDWIPAVDFELVLDWTDDPAVYIWLILNDEVDVESPPVRRKLAKVRDAIRDRLDEAGMKCWPYISVGSRSDVKELMTGTTA